MNLQGNLVLGWGGIKGFFDSFLGVFWWWKAGDDKEVRMEGKGKEKKMENWSFWKEGKELGMVGLGRICLEISMIDFDYVVLGVRR